MPISRLSSMKRGSARKRPRIAVTIGDPSGIGPEVTLKALASPTIKGLADFFVIGDGYVVNRLRRGMGLRSPSNLIDIDNIPHHEFAYGRSNPIFGKASIEYIDRAIDMIRLNEADAIVTGPINKSSISSAGYKGFEGHTEYLAERAKAKKFAMMFAGDKLKIVLVTRHIAMKDVPRSLTRDKIISAIELANDSLRRLFRIKSPVIAVAGLNPHAGENGSFGSEEENIIAPAIRMASKNIRNISGPVSPDAVFNAAISGRYDVVVSMYHDQALIPFKLLYFDKGVNITVGLPYVRTSPDHGTAFDIAGKGVADPSSMIEALGLACRLAARD